MCVCAEGRVAEEENLPLENIAAGLCVEKRASSLCASAGSSGCLLGGRERAIAGSIVGIRRRATNSVFT